MADLLRMRVEWSGSPVIGPGLSTFYFTDGAIGQSSDVEDFFHAIRFTLPAGLTITIPSGGDVIEDSDGSLQGVWGVGGAVAVTAEGDSEHAAGVGARVSWRTAGVNGGRRVVGSTFIVPLIRDMYDTDGTLAAVGLGQIQVAAAALVTAQASAFTIYSRSLNGGAGGNHEVLSSTVPDKVSWLRTRRT